MDLVAGTDTAVGLSASGDALARAGHTDVKVHAVDTDRWVVLDTQVNVLVDTESEVAGLGEVALAELVLLDLEATLENLLGLWSADGDVDGDLFVTTDTKGTDGVAGLACRKIVSVFCCIDLNSSASLDCRASSSSSSFSASRVITYCKLGFDQKAARAPWRHG